VIDYKSGSTVYGPAFASKGAVQLPLYMLALRAMYPQARVLGGFYVGLASGERGGMVGEPEADLEGAWATRAVRVAGERFESELEAALQTSRSAASGIRAGVIGARPAGGCPRYCDLRPLCRGRERRPIDVDEDGSAPPPAAAGLPVQLSLLGETGT
jgi:hypothetical protein